MGERERDKETASPTRSSGHDTPQHKQSQHTPRVLGRSRDTNLETSHVGQSPRAFNTATVSLLQSTFILKSEYYVNSFHYNIQGVGQEKKPVHVAAMLGLTIIVWQPQYNIFSSQLVESSQAEPGTFKTLRRDGRLHIYNQVHRKF